MQSGSRRAAAGARPDGIDRRYRGVAVLLAGLGVSGCVNTGQIANLIEERPGTTIAFESIEGPPPAVARKFVSSLEQQAGAHQVAVVAPGQASYRLRGYLAAHGEDGSTSVAWVWDVYDSDQRRTFRLSGEEKAADAGRVWGAADDQALDRIARTCMQQFAVMSTARPALDVASASAARWTESALGWIDDWAPEAAGIFRILRRAPSPPEIAEDAGRPLPPDEIPLPQGRPAPSGETSGSTFAFASAAR